MKQATLDCNELTGIDDLHDKLAEAFEFPEYYGANLDALYDMLTTGGDMELRLLNREALQMLPGTYGERVMETLEDAAHDQPRFRLVFSEEEGRRSAPEDDLDRIMSFIKKCGVFFLATVDGDQARVRPFGAIDRFEDRLYLQTGRVKNVFRQLEAGNRIELCCMEQGSSTWMRLAATPVLDDRMEARQHMLDANPMLKTMYAADDGNCEVFYLQDGEAVFASFAGPPKVIRF